MKNVEVGRTLKKQTNKQKNPDNGGVFKQIFSDCGQKVNVKNHQQQEHDTSSAWMVLTTKLADGIIFKILLMSHAVWLFLCGKFVSSL